LLKRACIQGSSRSQFEENPTMNIKGMILTFLRFIATKTLFVFLGGPKSTIKTTLYEKCIQLLVVHDEVHKSCYLDKRTFLDLKTRDTKKS